jgi:hypothetical protein
MTRDVPSGPFFPLFFSGGSFTLSVPSDTVPIPNFSIQKWEHALDRAHREIENGAHAACCMHAMRCGPECRILGNPTKRCQGQFKTVYFLYCAGIPVNSAVMKQPQGRKTPISPPQDGRDSVVVSTFAGSESTRPRRPNLFRKRVDRIQDAIRGREKRINGQMKQGGSESRRGSRLCVWAHQHWEE